MKKNNLKIVKIEKSKSLFNYENTFILIPNLINNNNNKNIFANMYL
mgnify:CR=1 FL=1